MRPKEKPKQQRPAVVPRQRRSAKSHTSSLSEGWIRPGIRAGSIDFLHSLSKPAAGSAANTLRRVGIVLPFTGYSGLRWQASPRKVPTQGAAHRREVWRYLLDVLLLTNADDF